MGFQLPKLNWWVYRILSINQLLTPSTVPFTDTLIRWTLRHLRGGFCASGKVVDNTAGRKVALKHIKTIQKPMKT